ncbi:MAG: hypothetical protein ABH842_04390 [Candidatus Micrarchaeota archaeon]
MKRLIFALMIFSIVFASFDQSYTHDMNRNGAATIEKTMDISIFSGQLSKNAFTNMKQYCDNTMDIDCSVDVDKKTVTITEKFSSGIYYGFSADYGVPHTTYILEIERIPTNVFSQKLESILVAIGEANASNDNPNPINLRDQETNQNLVTTLEVLKVNITYTVEMPSEIDSASIGTAQGSTVTFDVVEAMKGSQPVVVVSKEINYGYLIAILGIIVLLVVAYLFMISSKKRKPTETKKKRSVKK